MMHTPAFTDVVSCAEIAAAASVMNDHGIDIRLPWESTLDDVERERYEALVKALMAAISVRNDPDRIARYTAHVLASGSAGLGDDDRSGGFKLPPSLRGGRTMKERIEQSAPISRREYPDGRIPD